MLRLVLGTWVLLIAGGCTPRFQSRYAELPIGATEVVKRTVTLPSSLKMPAPGRTWKFVGRGDFKGDGEQEALFQNANGQPAIWSDTATGFTSGPTMTNPGIAWKALKVGDFNGDGKSDILWQNADGLLAIWVSTGTGFTSGFTMPNPGANWKVVEVRDFNGDGRLDILLQNADGQQSLWLRNGDGFTIERRSRTLSWAL